MFTRALLGQWIEVGGQKDVGSRTSKTNKRTVSVTTLHKHGEQKSIPEHTRWARKRNLTLENLLRLSCSNPRWWRASLTKMFYILHFLLEMLQVWAFSEYNVSSPSLSITPSFPPSLPLSPLPAAKPLIRDPFLHTTPPVKPGSRVMSGCELIFE